MTDHSIRRCCGTLRDAVEVRFFESAAMVGCWAYRCTHKKWNTDRPRRPYHSRCTALKDKRLDSQQQGMPYNSQCQMEGRRFNLRRLDVKQRALLNGVVFCATYEELPKLHGRQQLSQ